MYPSVHPLELPEVVQDFFIVDDRRLDLPLEPTNTGVEVDEEEHGVFEVRADTLALVVAVHAGTNELGVIHRISRKRA